MTPCLRELRTSCIIFANREDVNPFDALFPVGLSCSTREDSSPRRRNFELETVKGLNDYHAIFRILASIGIRGWISLVTPFY
jgi:hypothetical protein